MNTKVTLAGVELKNPVMTCSGTFGSGMEYGEMIDLDRLGAVVTKGIANVPWPGNPTPRVTEVYGGMLNAIGLQGPGVDVFMKRDVPFLRQHDTKIIESPRATMWTLWSALRTPTWTCSRSTSPARM